MTPPPTPVRQPPAGPDLELLLGDPTQTANPLGYAALVAADERGELSTAGERALHDHGLNAEFVPAALGGRLVGADHLMRRLRAVFRRDSALAIGYGLTSLIASVPVWTSGRPAQRARLAELLLAGGRAAACYTELPHGTDFGRAEFAARAQAGRLVLTGRKDLVNNVARADLLLLFARTDDRPGSRSHSHLLLDRSTLPPDRVTFGPRYPTSGVRGCQLGGVAFDNCPVSPDAVLGEAGTGIETVLRGFQVTRSVLPGMVVGSLDTMLRTVTRFALDRRLYGAPVADLPQTRAVLGGAFADLLVADCLATVAVRALHVLPEQAPVLAPAVKYLVPKLLQDAAYQLSVVLGARGYLREGDYAIFQKHLRDLPVVTLAHASSAVCLASIIPSLPVLARQAGDGPGEVSDQLYRWEEPLPALDFAGLQLTARRDDVCADLRAAHRELAGTGEPHRLTGIFVAELDRLRDRALALPPRDRTVTAGRPGFALAARYTVLLAAAACVGVWRHAPAASFLAEPTWLVTALTRLADRLGADGGQRWSTGADAERYRRLCAELSDRVADARSLDLADRRLAG
ncbi:acyl-CoA dehydrogenase family protein [Plantactinospora sp. B5E13]|uniref:acyl-CoA dehydrogenase family protein n=1 Tax=Plantactinospora sp. B5E13 TaxID=3153758 RepID=UPI00325D3D89